MGNLLLPGVRQRIVQRLFSVLHSGRCSSDDALNRILVRMNYCGPQVLAIEMGANATDLKLSIHPHPTLTETVMESAEVFFGQATHVYRPKRG